MERGEDYEPAKLWDVRPLDSSHPLVELYERVEARDGVEPIPLPGAEKFLRLSTVHWQALGVVVSVVAILVAIGSLVISLSYGARSEATFAQFEVSTSSRTVEGQPLTTTLSNPTEAELACDMRFSGHNFELTDQFALGPFEKLEMETALPGPERYNRSISCRVVGAGELVETSIVELAPVVVD